MAELKVGDLAPDFTGNTQNSETLSLSELKGGKTVLYFYPKDNTPGCTKQACAFASTYEEFKSENTVVIGISKDSVASHAKFAEKYSLPPRELSEAERTRLLEHPWPGNVRELQHAMERCVVMQTEFECPEETVVAETAGEMPTLNLEELERQAVMKAFDMANGNLSQAAVMLGITRYALYRKIGKIKSVL